MNLLEIFSRCLVLIAASACASDENWTYASPLGRPSRPITIVMPLATISKPPKNALMSLGAALYGSPLMRTMACYCNVKQAMERE